MCKLVFPTLAEVTDVVESEGNLAPTRCSGVRCLGRYYPRSTIIFSDGLRVWVVLLKPGIIPSVLTNISPRALRTS